MRNGVRTDRATIEKVVVTVVLTLWWLSGERVGYVAGDCGVDNATVAVAVWEHVGYMLSHGSVWHLAGNLFVLWMMRGRLYLGAALTLAAVMSWIPVVGSVWEGFGAVKGVTMGFSGVIFGIAGVKWGVAVERERRMRRKEEGGRRKERGGRRKEESSWVNQLPQAGFWLKAVPVALAGMLVPGVNWGLHCWCLLAGYVWGRVGGDER